MYSSIEISQRCECRRVVRFEHGDLVDSEFAVEYVEPQFLDGYLPADEFLAVFFKVVFRDRSNSRIVVTTSTAMMPRVTSRILIHFFMAVYLLFLSGSVC